MNTSYREAQISFVSGHSGSTSIFLFFLLIHLPMIVAFAKIISNFKILNKFILFTINSVIYLVFTMYPILLVTNLSKSNLMYYLICIFSICVLSSYYFHSFPVELFELKNGIHFLHITLKSF